jgi:Flp pilus assembly protein TadG
MISRLISQRLGSAWQRLSAFPKDEAGTVVVMLAGAMLMLSGFAALAIDGGRLYVTRGELQNGVDAAALAGAQRLYISDGEAHQTARDWAAKNDLAPDEVLSVTSGIRCNGETDGHTITVHVQRNVEYTFAQVLGFLDLDVTACATAKIGSPAQRDSVVPLAPRDETVNYDGSPTILKMDAPPTTGNTQAIALDATGANEFEENVMFGSEQEVCASESDPLNEICTTNSIFDTEPGNIRGKTETSIQWRLDNTSSECDTFEEVFEAVEGGKYSIKVGCNPFRGDDDSKRVVLVPIIDELCNGSCQVTILRLSVFWLLGFGPGGCSTGNLCEIEGIWVPVVNDVGGKLGDLDGDGSIVIARLVD